MTSEAAKFKALLMKRVLSSLRWRIFYPFVAGRGFSFPIPARQTNHSHIHLEVFRQCSCGLGADAAFAVEHEGRHGVSGPQDLPQCRRYDAGLLCGLSQRFQRRATWRIEPAVLSVVILRQQGQGIQIIPFAGGKLFGGSAQQAVQNLPGPLVLRRIASGRKGKFRTSLNSRPPRFARSLALRPFPQHLRYCQ